MAADRILLHMRPSRILQADAVTMDESLIDTVVQLLESEATILPVSLLSACGQLKLASDPSAAWMD